MRKITRPVKPLAGCHPRIHPKPVPGEAKRAKSGRPRMRHEEFENGRMQVDVQMAIHMVERQTGLRKSLELSRNLGLQLGLERASEKEFKARAHRIIAEAAVRIREVRNAFVRQNRISTNQGYVQPNAQAGIGPSQRHGFVKRLAAHHQTGRGENALSMGLNDGLVATVRASEIIRIDDQAGSAALRPGVLSRHNARLRGRP